MNILELADKGGPVFWVLFGYSVIAFAITLERLVHFALMGLGGNPSDDTLEKRVGPEGRVVAAIRSAFDDGVKDLGRVASRAGTAELRRMERGFRTLSFLAGTAPLLGLFGTVTGMIRAFMVIEQAGGKVDAQALAGGIWEAMITTGVGLAVALPILLALHALEGMADKRIALVRESASIALEQWGGGGRPDDMVIHRREPVDAV